MATIIPPVPANVLAEFDEIKCPVNPLHLVKCTTFVRIGLLKGEHVNIKIPDLVSYDAYCLDCEEQNGGRAEVLRSFQLVPELVGQ
jgi:hypothetical protein